MNISEIKAAISAKSGFTLGTMSMVRQFNDVADAQDATKTVKTATPWVSHWDNDHRVRVTMHEDIMTQLQSNPAKADLAFKSETIAAHGDVAAYTRYVIITPKDVVATF